MTHSETASKTPRDARIRHLLMLGCAAGAILAAAVAPSRAAAQSFNAAPTVTHGGAFITTPPGETNVVVETPSAVIVWQTLGAGDPFIFQPAGTTATFTGAPGYAVLNRILHQGRVQFDGTVIGRIAGASGGPGGTIAFAAPNGLILGGTALFDVGSLILTTLEPVVGASGQFIDGTGAIDLQPGSPNATLATLPGSRITALEDGSYVLIAGPNVAHGGTVLVNGSAAYVAASSAAVRHSSGLFDIFVTSGATGPTPLVHSGRTGGPAQSGAGDVHNIYMAAVSENLAITALVGGDVGYDAPLSATVENGAIILSTYSVGAPATNPATLAIGDGTYRSDVVGFSSHFAQAGGNATYQQDLTLLAGTAATVTADGSVIQIGGNLALVGRDPSVPIDPTGGIASIAAVNGGRVEVAGNALVDSSGVTILPGLFEAAADAVGGVAEVSSSGGTVSVGGSLTVAADGLATTVEIIPDVGGSGFGGTARVTTAEGGTVTVGGSLQASARASAQRSGGNPTVAPTATGGQVILETRGGGRIEVAGTTRLAADASGGQVSGLAGTAAGLARGGTVTIDVGTGDVTLAGITSIHTSASGGDGPTGGEAIGGAVTVQSADGTIQLAGGSSIDSSAQGGAAFSQPGGAGGNAAAGAITIAALSGTEPSSISGGGLTLTALGQGGAGGNGQGAVAPGQGGTGSGGSVSVEAQRGNGGIRFGALAIDARGVGGRGGSGDTGQNGASGGDGLGGASVSVGTERESAVASGPSAGSLELASLDVRGGGEGGDGGTAGGAGATGGTGGRGEGGLVRLASDSAPVTITGLARLAATGTGGAGGAANGGTAGATGTARGGELAIQSGEIAGSPGLLGVATLEGSLGALGDSGAANQAGAFQIVADSAINFGNVQIVALATGTPTVRPASDIVARNARVTVTGNGLFQSDGDLRLVAEGSGGLSGGTLALQSAADVTVAHAGRPADQFTVTGSDVTFGAGGNFTAGAGTQIRGTTSVTVAVDDIATFGDRLIGRDIFVTSDGIEILDTGRLGDAATQTVILSAGNPGARLGGDNVGSGYVLSAAEAGRITADELRFRGPAESGPASRPADIVVRDLSLDSNQVREFGIDTQGIVQVEGALLLSNAQPTSLLEISGDGGAERIQVIAPSGSIRVRSGSGAPGGTLRLDADNIWVTSQAVFEQLIADPNFAGRNAALLANGGTAEPRGYVEAFDVALTPLGTLFVQNSGTATDLGGITVGNSLTINAGTSSSPAEVQAFARALRADGTIVTGSTFFFGGLYNGTYTAGSELNLCNIPARACPAPPPPDEPEMGNPTPTQDEIAEPVGDGGTAFIPIGDPEMPIETAAANALIEEPVTSGGDSSVWVANEDRCTAEGGARAGDASDRRVCPLASEGPADE